MLRSWRNAVDQKVDLAVAGLQAEGSAVLEVASAGDAPEVDLVAEVLAVTEAVEVLAVIEAVEALAEVAQVVDSVVQAAASAAPEVASVEDVLEVDLGVVEVVIPEAAVGSIPPICCLASIATAMA